MRDPVSLSQRDAAGGNGDVGCGERVAAEAKRPGCQPVADAAGTDTPPIRGNFGAASKRQGEQIGHTEECAHATDLDGGVGFTWKTTLDTANVACRPADIHDYRVA